MYNLSGQSRLAYFGIWKEMHFMVSLMLQLVCYGVSIMLLGHVRVTQCRQLELTIQEDYGGSTCMWWTYFPRKLLYLHNYSQARGWRPWTRAGWYQDAVCSHWSKSSWAMSQFLSPSQVSREGRSLGAARLQWAPLTMCWAPLLHAQLCLRKDLWYLLFVTTELHDWKNSMSLIFHLMIKYFILHFKVLNVSYFIWGMRTL